MIPQCLLAKAVSSSRTLIIPVLTVFLAGWLDGRPAAAAPPQIKTAPTATSSNGTLRVVASDVTQLETADEIKTVIIANPEVLDATVITSHRLVLLGKKPGTTALLVLNAEGTPLLKSTVMIVPSDVGMVTVDRGIKETSLSCTPRCANPDPSKEAGPASAGAGPGAGVPAPQPATAPAIGAPTAANGPPLPPPTVKVNQ